MGSLRRYAPMKQSRGTVWPPKERAVIDARDDWQCIGALVGFPGDCFGGLEADHVRGSGGIGMKSDSVASNGVLLCSTHHRWKTDNGREARPKLLTYLSLFDERGTRL